MSQKVVSKKQISDQLKQRIKKKPYCQQINGTMFTYSILKKKNEKFIFSNDRFFVIKGIQTIGYARSIPEKTLLPFEVQQSLPPLKKAFNIENLVSVNAESDVVIIKFQDEEKETEWQFICQSKRLAVQWKNIIFQTKQQYTTLKNNNGVDLQMPSLRDLQLQANKKKQLENNSNGLEVILEQRRQTQSDGLQINDNIKGETKITKPISTFFVGGMAVESQKAQEQIKEQISQFGIFDSDIKENYLKRKKEEQKIRENLNSGDMLNILNTITNTNFELDKLKTQWAYQFAKGQNEYQIVEKFKIYIELLVCKIVDELALDERRRNYKPIQSSISHMKYEIQGVVLYFPLVQLNEASNFQERSTVISPSKLKETLHEFKNSNYILQITRNKGRLRIPLMMTCEYKGFTAIAKTKLHEVSSYNQLESLHREIELLQKQTRINNNIFQNEDNVKIIPVDQKYYEKLSRSQNKNKKFDICYIQQIKNYLPQDFYRLTKDINQFNRLRPQLIQDEQYQQIVFNGNDLLNIINRIKIPLDVKNSVNELTQISANIPERAQALILMLENLDETITNSDDIANVLHKHGINIRYLGLLIDTCKQSWLRSILNAQITARCCKHFLKFDFQDSTIHLNASSIDAVRDYHANQIINFLNKLFGNDSASQNFWKQLNKQAQTYFKCSINKQFINVGFLLQSLMKNCKFRLKNILMSEPYFKSNQIFSLNNFDQFVSHSKVYDLNFTELYSLIQSKMKQFSYESFEQVKAILNLNKRDNIDSHFKLNRSHQIIFGYLINWMSPQQAKFIYSPEQIQIGEILPTKSFYQIKLTEIKWYLKNGNIIQSERLRDQVIQHIGKWLGPFHQTITDLNDIFSNYYLNYKEQEKKAVNYCKGSIKNQQKLLGIQHIKLADGYYNLGHIFLNYNKKNQSLNSYKRAKQIISINESEDTQAFGEICLKIGQLYLASNSIKESLQNGRKAKSIASEYGNQKLFINSIELISRCYQVSEQWSSYLDFAYEIAPQIFNFRLDNQLLERIIKVTILPFFRIIASKSRQICRQILSILSQFSESTKTSSTTYNFLKTKIQQKIFPTLFIEYLNDIQEVLLEIDKNSLISRWKGYESGFSKITASKVSHQKSRGYNFLSLLDALNSYLGGYFIEGIFVEQK